MFLNSKPFWPTSLPVSFALRRGVPVPIAMSISPSEVLVGNVLTKVFTAVIACNKFRPAPASGKADEE